MSRTARIESSTGYYHVIMRGNNKNWIFKGEENKQNFIKLLKIQEKEGKLELVAWCIMDNHVHLIVKSEIKDMALAFKKINVSYAMRYNKRSDTIGHVFQDRFKSQPIETDDYLMQVVRYVHNNPVQAKMVKRLEQYKWSSYNDYFSKEKVIKSSQMQFVLAYFNNQLAEFKAFHKQSDDNEYLEIKEDLMKYRTEKAQGIIETFCTKHRITVAKEIYENKELIDKLLKLLIRQSKLPLRKIADLVGTSYNVVQQVNKIIKDEVN